MLFLPNEGSWPLKPEEELLVWLQEENNRRAFMLMSMETARLLNEHKIKEEAERAVMIMKRIKERRGKTVDISGAQRNLGLFVFHADTHYW